MEVFIIFKKIKNYFNRVSFNERKSLEKIELVKKSLKENIEYIEDEFKDSDDLTLREVKLGDISLTIVSLDGMVNKEVLAESVLNPILVAKDAILNKDGNQNKYDYIKSTVLTTTEQYELENFNKALNLLMSGFALLFVDGISKVIAIGIQGFSFRAVSEPSTEVTQKGSRESFIESIKVNITLIRRRLKNTNLKFENMILGSQSNTHITLCYLSNVVSARLLNEVKSKLQSIDLKYLLASEYLIPYLNGSGKISLFNEVGISERPDTVCGKISEGRIAILVDGAPTVLILPYLFIEYFHTFDDYAQNPLFATLARWLKYLSFLITILLPGVYVALGTFNPEAFPSKLVNKIATSIGETPFPIVFETLVIHFIYEIMREAGLRLPKPLGHAVSIIGGLVIGDAAVNSGLIGSPTLMVVALTAISSYIIPNLYEPCAVLRLLFILVGGIFGLLGVMILFTVVMLDICSKETYNVVFSSPVTPFSPSAMKDVFVRASWKELSKSYKKIQDISNENKI